jgi:hypothetical protein
MKILSAFVMVLVLAKGCNSLELRKESENISLNMRLQPVATIVK